MRHRFLRKSDLPECLGLLNPGFSVRADVRARLPELWGGLLDGERMIAHAIEDPSETGPRALAAFGMSVFASVAFVDAYLSAPRPSLAGLIYEELADGRSPLLGVEEVRAASAGEGLDLIVLHYVQRDWDLRHPKTREVLYAGHASIRLAHEGYNVKRLLDEGFGVQRQIMEAGGLLLKHDFSAQAPPGVPEEERSALYGLYREDVGDSLPGTTASFLFGRSRPRFGFSHAEQRVLLRAVVEESTDQEIAGELGVSQDAIKRVWRRVYERVAAAEPSLLHGGAEPELTRGNEKRRHLLAYLRIHLEELRPWPRSGVGRP